MDKKALEAFARKAVAVRTTIVRFTKINTISFGTFTMLLPHSRQNKFSLLQIKI